MIPLKEVALEKSGNLNGQTVKMEIDPDSLEHIHSLLSGLYSDPEKAVAREILSNALDSYELYKSLYGDTDPIQVTLPSYLNKNFTVQDFGVGMSLNDLINVYSKYGASSKRESNDQIGGFGLGAKAALSLVDSFIIISIKDGRKITANVTKDEFGIGELLIVSNVETDEHSGVTVITPIGNISSFNSKANEIIRFLQPGSMIVDGAQIKPLVGNEISPGMTLIDGINRDYLSIGGITYPVEMEDEQYTYRIVGIINSSWRNYGVIVNTPIGSVALTPSREVLKYTPATKKFILEKRKLFTETINKIAQDEVDACKTKSEALKKAAQWNGRDIHGLSVSKWNGVEIPSRWSTNVWKWSTENRRYSVDNIKTLHTSHLCGYRSNDTSGSLIVTGYEKGKPTPTLKKKYQLWAEENKKSYECVLFCKDMPGDGWLDNVDSVNFDDIWKIKIPRESLAVSSPRATSKYQTINKNGFRTAADKLTATNIYYFSPTDLSDDDYNYSRFFNALPADSQLVIIGKNRFAKLLRDFPNAVPFAEFIQKETKTRTDNLTRDDLIRLTWTGNEYLYSSLDADKVDDPDIKAAIKIWKTSESETLIQFNKINGVLNFRSTPDFEEKDPITKYPLLTNLYYYRFSGATMKQELYLYLNASYNAATLKEQSKKSK